jgi:hypothetical protein
MDYKKIALKVKCPYCNYSLMDYNKLIKGEPSIKLYVISGDFTGILNLCSLYGCYDRECDIKLFSGDIVDLFCPGCEKNLKIKSICNSCGAQMVNLRLETGGLLRICQRVDCKKHSVIFEDIYDSLTEYFIEHNYILR